jgi:hypothetical protein
MQRLVWIAAFEKIKPEISDIFHGQTVDGEVLKLKATEMSIN